MIKILTPNRTVRNFCFYQCVCKSSWDDVDNCTGKDCIFYKYRLGKGRVPIKTFRKFCLECVCGNREFVRNCITKDCLIYPYRMGRRPKNTLESIKEASGI